MYLLAPYRCIKTDKIRSHSLKEGELYYLQDKEYIFYDKEVNKTFVQVYRNFSDPVYIGRFDISRFKKEEIILDIGDPIKDFVNTGIKIPYYQLINWCYANENDIESISIIRWISDHINLNWYDGCGDFITIHKIPLFQSLFKGYPSKYNGFYLEEVSKKDENNE